MLHEFETAYKKLNKEQKTAVDSLDGPIMVIAGPGTGKTQILTLRIANILNQGIGVTPDSILCLTFTRSGVTAMRQRLESYIGTTARNVKISTFHSFAITLVEKYFTLLDFSHVPKLLDDDQNVFIVDELLQNGSWEYLRPRTDPTKYFKDLKTLISILKRERMTPDDFLKQVEQEIKALENDPDSISTRGESKGKLKKEIEKKIESLHRTREVVSFYEKYEDAKKQRDLMDYDDVLEYAVKLAEEFEDVRAELQINYQYILVDEHQDSSGVQNDFLKAVWANDDMPHEANIFVVGDDRQLIYGFSGANLNYFTEFKTAFGTAKMITLTENYRSTKPILKLADDLLKSSVTNEALNSNREGNDLVTLLEFNFGRDEIIGAGLYFKKQIEAGVSLNECALLVPKNYHVRFAGNILRSMEIPVVSEQKTSLLDLPETKSLMGVLGIIADPNNSLLLVESLLDQSSNTSPLDAHKFLKNFKKPDTITLDDLVNYGSTEGLFAGEHVIAKFGVRLKTWIETLAHERPSHVVSIIGNELLINESKNHNELMRSIEVVRSFLHASSAWESKHQTGALGEFIKYFERLNEYGNNVSVAEFGGKDGVRIMTLHKSKGLEFDHVWIGHMNEEVFMSEKRSAFTLPELVQEKINERDVLTAKRELYVAITRAKKFCTISYAQKRDDGTDLALVNIIADLPPSHFVKKSASENELEILADNPRNFAPYPSASQSLGTSPTRGGQLLGQVQDFVRERFSETNISVSMLNNFFECPWKWYFRNFLKLPQTKSVSLALGSAVHSTIEFILKEKTLPSKKIISETIARELEKEGIYDKKDLVRLTKSAQFAVQSWIDGYYADLANDRKSERSISYRDKQFPNLTMYGKIDLTERFPDGTILVTDFKTGTSKTTGVIEKLDDENRLSSYMRQLAMYSYLIRGAEGNDVSESRLLFLEEDSKNKNALYRTHVTSEQIELLVRDISDYQEMLSSGKWTDRPCHVKTYGGSSECEYCARMEKILGK